MEINRHTGTAARRATARQLGLLIAVFALPVLAAPPEQVPDPLTLDAALAYAEDHPRVTAPTETLPRRQPIFLGCHALAFTGTRGQDAERDVGWSALISPLAAQRLEIRQRFYDVLLGDLSYARDNEALAVAFILFDRAAVRQSLGQVSPLRTAELEAEYQLIRRQRAAAESAQRVTRSLLAMAMGRPTELARNLVTPDLAGTGGPPPDLEAVVGSAFGENRWLQEMLTGRSPAERQVYEMEVRQQALELITRLELLAVTAEQTRTESAWRDLKLDESRTLYEMEVRADLGYSMSQQTKARGDEETVALCQALTRAELEALQGRLP